jgi:hypothetical protein
MCACITLLLTVVTVAASALPLDGHDQWPTISKGISTPRKFIVHNVPITARPVQIKNTTDRRTGKPTTAITTSVCLSNVDNRTGQAALTHSLTHSLTLYRHSSG